MSTDEFELKQLKERLDREKSDKDRLKMVWMWIKQGRLTLVQFQKLVRMDP